MNNTAGNPYWDDRGQQAAAEEEDDEEEEEEEEEDDEELAAVLYGGLGMTVKRRGTIVVSDVRSC